MSINLSWKNVKQAPNMPVNNLIILFWGGGNNLYYWWITFFFSPISLPDKCKIICSTMLIQWSLFCSKIRITVFKLQHFVILLLTLGIFIMTFWINQDIFIFQWSSVQLIVEGKLIELKKIHFPGIEFRILAQILYIYNCLTHRNTWMYIRIVWIFE